MAQGMWHYSKDGQQQSPAPWETLLAMARAGTLAPTDMVWSDGMSDWKEAGTVAGLFEQNPVAPPAIDYATPAPLAMGLNYYNPNQAHIRYAGFWIRFCAAFVDGLILLIPLTALKFAVNFSINGTILDSPRLGPAFLINELSSIGIGWLYSALMQSSEKQATLGMQATGLRVTDLYGQRLTFARATGRFFAYYLSVFTLGIGFLMILFTERKQTLHDMIAGAVVTYKKG